MHAGAVILVDAANIFNNINRRLALQAFTTYVRPLRSYSLIVIYPIQISQQTSLFMDANETRKEDTTFRAHCSARPQVTVNTRQYGEGYLS